jgi:ABC-type transport system substrate-binding protein
MRRSQWAGLLSVVVLASTAAPVSVGAQQPGTGESSQASRQASPPAAAQRVLRVAFANRDNGFDPAQVSDVISAALANSLFDAPLTYDVLARPARLKPNTATALPEASDGYRRFVFRIKPGIFFSEHPAFKGPDGRQVPRELVAADYVYSIKRYYDPATRSPTLFHFEGAGLLGLSELRKKALDEKTPFDYDTDVPGLRALDRYSFEVRLANPAPRLPYVFATGALTGALAREVVEAEGKLIAEKPVGTGPFRLAAWTRGSRIVLERNPAHDHSVYDAEPNADDTAGQAIAARLRGRALPFLDRVEINIIEEGQPRWLSFLNGQLDVLQVPVEFSAVALPGGQLNANLQRNGATLNRVVAPSTAYTYFGMDHPLVGGYTPDRVALRRALSLAYDTQREIDLVRRGQAVAPQSLLPPGVSGFSPSFKSEMSTYDLARAKALLDLYGYVDQNGDGWRDQPDGKPLELEMTSEPSQISRQAQDLWKKAMTRVGVRIDFRVSAWQENIKASRAGKLMMWGTGWSAAIPDGSYFLDVLYSKNKGQSNHARFGHPEVDALHERQRTMPDGPERDKLIHDALRLSLAYMPLKATAHPIENWVAHGHVQGFRPHPFIRDYWRFIDVNAPAP